MIRNLVLAGIAAAGLGAVAISAATPAEADHWRGRGYHRPHYSYYGGPPRWRRDWGWRRGHYAPPVYYRPYGRVYSRRVPVYPY